MSLLMLRGPILGQAGAAAPPVDVGAPWQLDASRRPSGYTLSDGNLTAVNTSGGSDYRRWVPSERALHPWDGRRYWEVLCAASGAATFDGYMGVVSEAMRAFYDEGWNPISGGSIGWRGNGTLWSTNAGPSADSTQQLTGLPTFGAGDVLMFVFEPASAKLWIGKNGSWRDDPTSGAPSWTSGGSSAFHPQVQGRNAGDGGTLRSQPSQFAYPLPPGVLPLGYEVPELRIYATDAFLELGWDETQSVADAAAFLELGGGEAFLAAAAVELFIDMGGASGLTAARSDLYIEVELP